MITLPELHERIGALVMPTRFVIEPRWMYRRFDEFAVLVEFRDTKSDVIVRGYRMGNNVSLSWYGGEEVEPADNPDEHDQERGPHVRESARPVSSRPAPY